MRWRISTQSEASDSIGIPHLNCWGIRIPHPASTPEWLGHQDGDVLSIELSSLVPKHIQQHPIGHLYHTLGIDYAHRTVPGINLLRNGIIHAARGICKIIANVKKNSICKVFD
jgi:hypothetical protein